MSVDTYERKVMFTNNTNVCSQIISVLFMDVMFIYYTSSCLVTPALRKCPTMAYKQHNSDSNQVNCDAYKAIVLLATVTFIINSINIAKY